MDLDLEAVRARLLGPVPVPLGDDEVLHLANEVQRLRHRAEWQERFIKRFRVKYNEVLTERDRLRGWWERLRSAAEVSADAPEARLSPEATAFSERYRAALDVETIAEAALFGAPVPAEEDTP